MKLQNLPEEKKKAIFFAVIITATIIAVFLGVIFTKNNLERLNQSAQSVNLPSIEMPEINEKRMNISGSEKLEELGTAIEDINSQIDEMGLNQTDETILDELGQVPDNFIDNEINSIDKDIQGF